jgi:hypothetical protein
VPGSRQPGAALVGALAGAAPFAVLAGVRRAAWPLLPGLAAAAWVGARWGRRRPDRCADPECEAILPPQTAACPGCGRRVAGTIARPEDRLEAEERLRGRDALDHEALGAGAPRADG